MKYTFKELKFAIEKHTPLKVCFNPYIMCYGMWNPGAGKILYDDRHHPDKVVETLVHELAHYVANREFEIKLGLLNDELLAFSVEKLIVYDQPIEVTIADLFQRIQEAYRIEGNVTVQMNQIMQVVSRVIEIIGFKS